MKSMPYKILAINPGSTSTKVALYEDKQRISSASIEHPAESLAGFKTVKDQLPLRRDGILEFLQKGNIEIASLSAIVGRGGILPPLPSGAFRVNELMIDRLVNRTLSEHASNLGALLANELGKLHEIPAFIYDPVSVDEMAEIAKITGIPEIKRRSQLHALNMRAAALKTAAALGKPYPETTLIAAHLGGGISLSLHYRGKMIDMISDDEGPFAPERSGRIPGQLLTELCYAGTYSKQDMKKKLRGNSGLKAHLGTVDSREIERRISEGDEQAKLVYSAMAYTVAKGIGELATVVSGKVDRIILTGGIAYSQLFTGWISERVEFIAPVQIIPGENELEALAHGVLRILSGEEKAHDYRE